MAQFLTTEALDKPPGTSSGPAVRYPLNLGNPPFEKWMLFQVKSGRHILRTGIKAESGDNVDKTIKAVALYLPPEALNSSLSVEYSQGTYGVVAGAAIAAAIQNGTTAEKPASKLSLDDVIPALKSGVISGGAALAREKFTDYTQSFLNTAGFNNAANVAAVVDGLSGSTINPRTDIFFSNVNYRTHNFSFTLVPRSLEEAQAIDEILNVFQFYMLPSFGGETDVDSAFIGYPYEFEIDMFTQHNGSAHHINTIDRSVLETVTINHASNSRVSFVDQYGGNQYYPTSTTITLQFKEVRLQGRNRQTKIWHGENRKWNQTKYPDPRSGSTEETIAAETKAFGEKLVKEATAALPQVVKNIIPGT